VIIAIDPGASGGIVFGASNGLVVYPMPETETDVVNTIREHIELSRADDVEPVVVIEKVGGYAGGPGQPGSAMFSFGRGTGILYGCLMYAMVRIVEVTPQKWQKALSLGTRSGMEKRDWKNKLKAEAQRLYPAQKVTLKTADALLIYEYAKRTVSN
jgi:hypothetical protein